MSLFNPSTKAVSAACQEIADTAAASGDTEATTRAGRSLFAALEHFNNRANWDFALVEGTPITLFGPFTVTGVTAVAGQVSAQAPQNSGIKIDDLITGNGFLAGTRVTATATAAGPKDVFGVNQAITTNIGTSVTVIRDFYDLPSDWKSVYSIKLYTNQNSLRIARRRTWDRSVFDEYTPGTPLYYDVFGIGGKGKVRLLPPPAATDSMQLRYYRRLTVPTTTATADALDIPQDYEPYLVAWAKWHYLIDKSEARGDQAQTWISFANDGLKMMLADQTRIPDEEVMFVPGHYSFGYNINSTRQRDWDYTG